MTTTTKGEAIPQRSDVEEKDQWNLADIYVDDEKWEADYKKAEGLIEKADGFKDKLGESASTLYECLETRSSLSLICDNLHQYAKMSQDLDSRMSKYQAMTDRAAMLSSKVTAAFSFVEPELLQIDDDTLREMADQFPKTDVYDFYIRELIRSRAHIRSAEVEEILAQVDMIARGPDSIFGMLDNADISYPTIKDENGKDLKLTKQRYQKIVMECPKQNVRRDANDAFMSSYKELLNTIGSTLTTAVNKDIFYAKARKYKNSLHHSLDAGNIPVEVYHSLLDTTESNLEPLHKWMSVRKRILGLDKLFSYDVYCPLFPDMTYSIPYDEAVKQVLEAVSPLGEAYCRDLKSGFDKRWVDVYETEGKRGGAYSWGSYSSHPFVLMNYNDTINNMFTLAHEMGHAMHSFLSNRKQPYQKASYSIFVAEVASTLNEGLLLDYLLKKAEDDKRRLFLLNRQIDNTLGTFFHQVMFARFELMIHETIEKGVALSPDLMNKMWAELTEKYYGPVMEKDDFTKYKWARIPHFYWNFYVYQYATSFAASQAILKRFLGGEDGLIEKYLGLISSGGNDYPIEQLMKCGVDMTTSDPVDATIQLFSQQVDELEKIAAE
jgi:oligoendopeptidase F